MKRKVIIVRKALISVSFLAVAATASAAYAAYSVLDGENDLVSPQSYYHEREEVLIEVAEEDLGRCVMTIAHVMDAPLAEDQPVEMSSDMPAAPPVRCVVE